MSVAETIEPQRRRHRYQRIGNTIVQWI